MSLINNEFDELKRSLIKCEVDELIDELKDNNIEYIFNKVALYVNVTFKNVRVLDEILERYNFNIVDEVCEEFNDNKHWYIVNINNLEVLNAIEIKKVFKNYFKCIDSVKNCFYVSLDYFNIDCYNIDMEFYDMGVDEIIIGERLNNIRRRLNIKFNSEFDGAYNYVKFKVNNKIVNYY